MRTRTHPLSNLLMGHRNTHVRACQLQLPQVVAGLRQRPQKVWQALQAQTRQAATVRHPWPSLFPPP